MFKTVVHIYGLPRAISDINKVEIGLKDGAGMADVVAALREKVPALEGPVICPGENRLRAFYKFNINGHFYFTGMDFELYSSDRISLLMPVYGG